MLNADEVFLRILLKGGADRVEAIFSHPAVAVVTHSRHVRCAGYGEVFEWSRE